MSTSSGEPLTGNALDVPQIEKKKKTKRQQLVFFLRCFVSILLIIFVLSRSNLTEIFAAMKSANILFLFFSFLLTYVGFAISSIRWQVLLRAQDIEIPLGFLLRSFIVSIFFTNFLPSTVGGDAYRFYDSYRFSQKKAAPAVVLIIGRLLGIFILILFASIALLMLGNVNEQLLQLRWFVFAGLLLIIIFVGLLFFGKRFAVENSAKKRMFLFYNLFLKAVNAFTMFRGHTRALLLALLYSALLQVNVVFHNYLIGKALGIPLGISHFFFIVPLMLIISLLPITINGIGIRENANIFLFGIFAVPAFSAVAYSWLFFGIILLNGVIGGIVYLIRK